MCNMLGLGDMNADQLASKLEETLPVIRSVSEQFKDPVSVATWSLWSVLFLDTWTNQQDQLSVAYRSRRRSSVCALLSFCLCTRQSVWFKSWPSVASTRTILSSTSWFFLRQSGPAKCARPDTRFSPSTWTRSVTFQSSYVMSSNLV